MRRLWEGRKNRFQTSKPSNLSPSLRALLASDFHDAQPESRNAPARHQPRARGAHAAADQRASHFARKSGRSGAGARPRGARADLKASLRLDNAGLGWHTVYAHMEGTQRAHILIPGDLLREIDALVGPRGRSAFLLETARQEVQRRKLLGLLESKHPAWKAEDHPELAAGAATWVRKLRQQSEKREARYQSGGPGGGREQLAASERRSSVKRRRSR